MDLRFYLDPNGIAHIYRHGVNENEVDEVLSDPGEDRMGREGTRVATGRTAAGRYLRVIYVPKGDDILVITAYELRGKPLVARRRYLRRKGKL